MKKLLFFGVLAFGSTLVACSDDDESSLTCVTCVLIDEETGQNDSQEVCEDNGNAIVGGTDTGSTYTAYLSLMASAGYTCN